MGDPSFPEWNEYFPMHPLTAQFPSGKCLALTEARNHEFLSLRFEREKRKPERVFASFSYHEIPENGTTLTTPWFTFILGNSPASMIENSYLVENLNDPLAIRDPSWITPGKVYRDMSLSTSTAHAAVEVASKLNFQHILLDAGWYGPEFSYDSVAIRWLKVPKKAPLDILNVVEYARSKGVGVFLYVNDIALKKQFKEVLPVLASWGISGIKFGFVNLASSRDTKRILGYVRRCADYRLMVNIHDAYRPSGFSR